MKAFLKKWGLKAVLPAAVLLIALVIALIFLCGIRGVYVNVNNPNEFYSFGVTKFSYALDSEETHGKWKKDGATLQTTYNVPMFGEMTVPVQFKKLDGNGYIELDGSEYERVSIIRKEHVLKKVKITFNPNGGVLEGASEIKAEFGGKIPGEDYPKVTRAAENGAEYELAGWYYTPQGFMEEGQRAYDLTARQWKNVTLYANWRNLTQYEMTGEAIPGGKVYFREGDNLLSVFKNAVGWGEELPAGVKEVKFTDEYDKEITGRAPARNVKAEIVYDVIIEEGVLTYVNPEMVSYVVPREVNRISASAFEGCTALTDITVNYGVTAEEGAFDDCINLVSATVDGFSCEIVKEIPTLREVTVTGDGRTDYNALRDCSHLKKITVADGIKTISSGTFQNCSGAETIIIPASVTVIGQDAFSGCTAEIIFEDIDAVTEISYRGYKGKTAVVPAGVTVIPQEMFYECTAEVDWGNSQVTEIAYHGFFNYGGFLLTLPDTVEEIEDLAFQGSALIRVTFGRGLKKIGEDIFLHSTVAEVYNRSSVPSSEIDVYSYTDPENSRLALVEDKFWFYGTSSSARLWLVLPGEETEITLPEEFTAFGRKVTKYSISRDAFGEVCETVAKVNLPAGITGIDIETFENCIKLTDLVYDGEKEYWQENLFENYNGQMLRFYRSKVTVTFADGSHINYTFS